MKKNPVDDLFARKLRQAETEPRDEAWVKLQSRLQTKERRLVFGWPSGAWLAAAGLSLLLVSGWVLWQNRSPESASVAQIAPRPTTKKTSNVEIKTNETQVAVVDKNAGNQQNNSEKLLPKTNRKSQLATQNQLIVSSQETTVVQQTKIPKTVEKEIEKPLLVAPMPTNAIAQTPTPAQKTVVMQLPELPVVALAKANQETQETPLIETAPTKANRKPSRFARLVRQLQNVKEGERVDWEEVGVNPDKLLAKVTRKTEEKPSENK